MLSQLLNLTKNLAFSISSNALKARQNVKKVKIIFKLLITSKTFMH